MLARSRTSSGSPRPPSSWATAISRSWRRAPRTPLTPAPTRPGAAASLSNTSSDPDTPADPTAHPEADTGSDAAPLPAADAAADPTPDSTAHGCAGLHLAARAQGGQRPDPTARDRRRYRGWRSAVRGRADRWIGSSGRDCPGPTGGGQCGRQRRGRRYPKSARAGHPGARRHPRLADDDAGRDGANAALRLALDGARGHAAHEVALHRQKDDEGQRHRDEGRGGEQLVGLAE